jgi:hypothetical protein
MVFKVEVEHYLMWLASGNGVGGVGVTGQGGHVGHNAVHSDDGEGSGEDAFPILDTCFSKYPR